jgi:hypothetical protein
MDLLSLLKHRRVFHLKIVSLLKHRRVSHLEIVLLLKHRRIAHLVEKAEGLADDPPQLLQPHGVRVLTHSGRLDGLR